MTDNNIPQPSRRLLRVGITQGDTNAVGYELILKTFEAREMYDICIPVVYGSMKTATYHRKVLGAETAFSLIPDATQAEEGALNLVSCYDEEVKIDLGCATPEGGWAARKALERGVEDLKAGRIDVLVTCPINKATIKSEDFTFVGHTEYLQAHLGGEGDEALMIMTGPRTRVAVVTSHVALRDVPDLITQENVERKARLFLKSLHRDFMLSAPRLAVLGLNPHNGDRGTIGSEDEEVIRPVVEKLAAEGLCVFGPFAADGFFGSGNYRSYDGVLAMYHDQGLTPFKLLNMGDGIYSPDKMLNMGDGVNFTAGLPFVRTSPDHGTAYEIAGKGIADETSFREAVYAAIDIYRNRVADDEATANPLPKLYHDRREGERPRRFNRDFNAPAEEANATAETEA